jgi:hypothetical protein
MDLDDSTPYQSSTLAMASSCLMLFNTYIIKLAQTETDIIVSRSLSQHASSYWRIGELGVEQNWSNTIL